MSKQQYATGRFVSSIIPILNLNADQNIKDNVSLSELLGSGKWIPSAIYLPWLMKIGLCCICTVAFPSSNHQRARLLGCHCPAAHHSGICSSHGILYSGRIFCRPNRPAESVYCSLLWRNCDRIRDCRSTSDLYARPHICGMLYCRMWNLSR